MISVRMYQDERQPCMGKQQHFANSTVHSTEWFRSTDLWVMGSARFLCGTLLNKDGVYVITNDEILIFIYIVFAINKQKLASSEDRTHDLQIMRLTRCLLC